MPRTMVLEIQLLWQSSVFGKQGEGLLLSEKRKVMFWNDFSLILANVRFFISNTME